MKPLNTRAVERDETTWPITAHLKREHVFQDVIIYAVGKKVEIVRLIRKFVVAG